MKKRITILFFVSTLILAVCLVFEWNKTSGGQWTNMIHTAENSAQSEEKEQELLVQRNAQEGFYSYDLLSETEQEIYAQIYVSITQRKEAELSTTDAEVLEKVFQCVLNDHPEIFYVEGYTFTKYTRGKEITKLIFEASYTMEQVEAEAKQKEMEVRADRILEGITAEMDDYEKIKYIYEYIIEHTEYNVEAGNNQNICSVFLDGQSVCQGYAKATQYLLNKAGIKATLVTGTVESGEGHAWNLVYADGEPYYVDTTWGDASYRMTTEESHEVSNLPVINYDYLCVTTKRLCKTHTIQNVVELPECTAVKDNYYVREGAYFTQMNEEQLAGLFEKSYAEKKAYITLQCADETVYQSMYEELIAGQKIFEYMDAADGVVAYSQNEEQLSLSFWLSE